MIFTLEFTFVFKTVIWNTAIHSELEQGTADVQRWSLVINSSECERLASSFSPGWRPCAVSLYAAFWPLGKHPPASRSQRCPARSTGRRKPPSGTSRHWGHRNTTSYKQEPVSWSLYFMYIHLCVRQLWACEGHHTKKKKFESGSVVIGNKNITN